MRPLLPSLALVVEYDQFQGELLSEFLKNENIDVIQCESAEAAELVIARAGVELSLLVTDVQQGSPCGPVQACAQLARS